MIGSALSHFKIVAKLGEGGMGEVYLAHDTQLERKVALKVLPAEVAGDPERLKRLQREARSLAALDHPHIVPVYSLESFEGVHFLTMAFIEGESLYRLIPEEGFSLERLLDLAVPLADALRAAHQQGIIHRDLKPANVMLDRDGRLRVLDFGLAKRDVAAVGDLSQLTTQARTEQMTREGTILGTYPYMSPEQAEGRAVDARSDLFSFGVMLYEMACGRRPFAGETGIGLITAILRDEQRPLGEIKPDLPLRLDEIVTRCLEKDPEKRYPTAEELRDDLESLRREVTRGTAVSAAEAPPPTSQLETTVAPAPVARRAGAKPTRRRTLWLGVAAAVGIAAGIATWSLWPRGGEIRSLAVLPFENTQNDEESEYLCDGVAESLIRQVSNLPSVKVSPLSAGLNFKGQDIDPAEAGRQLGVETVLVGTLTREEDDLQITAKLVEADSGVELWSNTYERASEDLLHVQDEIAGAILDDGLRIQLTADERRELVRNPTTNGEAYDLFLQARHLERLATEDDYLEALELLQRATVRDPQFARAYYLIGGIHAILAVDGLARPTDAWPLANRYARQALAIDPDLVEARGLEHSMAFFFDWDWEGAERERRQLLQSPVGEFDPGFLRALALELWAVGRPEEALGLARRSRELDPLSTPLAMLEADYLVKAGRIDAAIALYEHTIEDEPDNPEPYFGLAEALFQQGRFDEANEARRRAHAVWGDDELAELFAAARGEQGYREADRVWVRRQLAWLEERSAWAYVSPLDLARVYAQLGDSESAFAYLEQAFVDRSPGLVFLNVDRVWDDVREDPRFLAAVRRVGLPSSG